MPSKLLRVVSAVSSLALLACASAAGAEDEEATYSYPIASAELRVEPPTHEPLLLEFYISERFYKYRMASDYWLELKVTNTSEHVINLAVPKYFPCEFRVLAADGGEWNSCQHALYPMYLTNLEIQPAESIEYSAPWAGLWSDRSPACCATAKFVATLKLAGSPLEVVLEGVDTPRAIRRQAVSEMQMRISSLERPFEDLPLDHWAYNALEYLSRRGLQRYYPAGFFDGSVPRMRADFIKAIQTMLEDPRIDKSDEQTRIMLDTMRSEFSAQYY